MIILLATVAGEKEQSLRLPLWYVRLSINQALNTGRLFCREKGPRARDVRWTEARQIRPCAEAENIHLHTLAACQIPPSLHCCSQGEQEEEYRNEMGFFSFFKKTTHFQQISTHSFLFWAKIFQNITDFQLFYPGKHINLLR